MERTRRGTEVSYGDLSDEEERIGTLIADAAFHVHRELGPGLLEHVYEVCFCHELTRRGLKAERQVKLPITYDGIIFEDALRLDVLVEDLVICELKSAETGADLFRAQLLTQLRFSGKHLGYLINFNVPLLKKGIQRIVRSGQ